jgi:peroxiredoxin
MNALPLLLLTLLQAEPAAARPGVGDVAPAFKAPATSGAPVSLADYAKKKTVVLAFFPKAFTGG